MPVVCFLPKFYLLTHSEAAALWSWRLGDSPRCLGGRRPQGAEREAGSQVQLACLLISPNLVHDQQ